MARQTKDGKVVKPRKTNLGMNDFLTAVITEMVQGKRSILALVKKLDRKQDNIDNRLCDFLKKNENWYDKCASHPNKKDKNPFFTKLSTKEEPEINYSDWKDQPRGARGLTLDIELIFGDTKIDDNEAIDK